MAPVQLNSTQTCYNDPGYDTSCLYKNVTYYTTDDEYLDPSSHWRVSHAYIPLAILGALTLGLLLLSALLAHRNRKLHRRIREMEHNGTGYDAGSAMASEKMNGTPVVTVAPMGGRTGEEVVTVTPAAGNPAVINAPQGSTVIDSSAAGGPFGTAGRPPGTGPSSSTNAPTTFTTDAPTTIVTAAPASGSDAAVANPTVTAAQSEAAPTTRMQPGAPVPGKVVQEAPRV